MQRSDAIGGNVDPAGDLRIEQPRTEGRLQTEGHPRAGFARADNDQPIEARQIERLAADLKRRGATAHRVANEQRRIDGGDSRLPDGFGVTAW